MASNPDQHEIDPLVTQAVDACAEVRGYAIDLNKTAEQKLRAVRQAGRLLALVHRSVGGRRPRNWSSGLTSYQLALKQGHVSRQTANQWRRVSEVSDEMFEQFIANAKTFGWELTIVALLRACTPSSAEEQKKHTVTFTLSQADHGVFAKQLAILRAAHFANTPAETLMNVFDRAYRDWRVSQGLPPRQY